MALVVNFAEHFRARRSEWLLALAMCAIGTAYTCVEGLFSNQYFTTMLALATQGTWGAIVLGLGLMRLVMLWINGRWSVSPYFRGLGAVAGAVLWTILFVSAFTSERLVQSVGLWLLFAIFDLIAASDAAGDARIAYEKRRDPTSGVCRAGTI